MSSREATRGGPWTAYSDLTVERTNGSPVTVGTAVRDTREAEWLAATLRSALGL